MLSRSFSGGNLSLPSPSRLPRASSGSLAAPGLALERAPVRRSPSQRCHASRFSDDRPAELWDSQEPSTKDFASCGAEPSHPAPHAESWDFGSDELLAVPWPANLPVSEDGYHPLEFYPTSQLDVSWGGGAPTGQDFELRQADQHRGGRTYVLLFGVGMGESCETEGIYSLRATARDTGLPLETIVAFEDLDDAERYCTLLEATMDHKATVCPIVWEELLEFCNSCNYRCRLEPRGSLLIPPEFNVSVTDWEKSNRLRKGEFSVLDSEPVLPATAASQLFIDGADWLCEPQRPGESCNVVGSLGLDPAQLEAVRQSLERLLPRD